MREGYARGRAGATGKPGLISGPRGVVAVRPEGAAAGGLEPVSRLAIGPKNGGQVSDPVQMRCASSYFGLLWCFAII